MAVIGGETNIEEDMKNIEEVALNIKEGALNTRDTMVTRD
jgi:hypothetical protein